MIIYNRLDVFDLSILTILLLINLNFNAGITYRYN